MTDKTKEILSQRGAEYGDYATMSTAIQAIKREIHNWDTHGIPAPHMEALDMIATKMGRILTGNHDNVDSWQDIAGYATLVANRIRAEKERPDNDEKEKAAIRELSKNGWLVDSGASHSRLVVYTHPQHGAWAAENSVRALEVIKARGLL